jgi:uncharacterized protein YegP (UPF0339 family)
MATATKNSRARRQVARRAAAGSDSVAITFRVFEDNGGSYFWTIRCSDGESLAHSGRYATRDDAAHAARVVRDGAASARFEPGAVTDRPVDLVARRSATAVRDDSEAERWLDEGGSFSGETVTQ